MGKTGKNLKRKRLQEQLDHSPSLPGTPVDTTFLEGLVSAADIAVTVRTLNTLVHNEELLKNKNDLKALRGAVFDFQRVSANQGASFFFACPLSAS